jgi:hypothetical protein
MKRYMKLLMIWTLVLLGAAMFMSTSASAVIVGTAPTSEIANPFIGPVLPSSIVRPPIGLTAGLVRPPIGFAPGLVRPPFFNPFLIRPFFNPFFNPFIDIDAVGLPLGLGVNPGLAD